MVVTAPLENVSLLITILLLHLHAVAPHRNTWLLAIPPLVHVGRLLLPLEAVCIAVMATSSEQREHS